MLLIAALGNPGRKYQDTKHNFGYWVGDKIAEKNNVSFRAGKGKYVYTRIPGRMIMVKPVTYMNDSGVAVAEAMRYFNIEPENLLTVYDDIDLPLGSLRFRASGGAGGHKGVESIIYHCRSEGFARLRLGIATGDNMRPAEKYVLRPFHKSYSDTVSSVIHDACDGVEFLLSDGIDAAMNKYNQKG